MIGIDVPCLTDMNELFIIGLRSIFVGMQFVSIVLLSLTLLLLLLIDKITRSYLAGYHYFLQKNLLAVEHDH